MIKQMGRPPMLTRIPAGGAGEFMGSVRWLFASLLTLVLVPALHLPAAAQGLDAATYRKAQEYMLQQINAVRVKRGAQAVELDPVAGQTAKAHAEDMLRSEYFSHWNMQGLKPTRRWNLLGGYDSVSENIYYHVGRRSDIFQACDQAMDTLLKSPGHRQTILDPHHTHVGLGFAVEERQGRFYVDQTFVTRLGGEYSCPPSARVGETVALKGRFDAGRYEFDHVIVGYEELPRQRDRKWLDKTGSYGDAQDHVAAYCCNPRIRFNGMPTYYDVQATADGSFTCNAELNFKGKEGLYYLFVWLREKGSGRGGDTVLAAVATVEVRK
jgi:uncharacterized protein YkwD